jgi:hypothetical protein
VRLNRGKFPPYRPWMFEIVLIAIIADPTAPNKTDLHRVGADCEQDCDGGGRSLCRESRTSTDCDDQGYLDSD